jgi:hypothetical protein
LTLKNILKSAIWTWPMMGTIGKSSYHWSSLRSNYFFSWFELGWSISYSPITEKSDSAVLSQPDNIMIKQEISATGLSG